MPQVDRVPTDFARRIVEVWGSAGAEWLDRLPSLLADWSQRRSLPVGPAFEPLSYNYVAPALRADGTKVVVKLGGVGPVAASPDGKFVLTTDEEGNGILWYLPALLK